MGAKPVIAIRCDASPEIGTGHVRRCMTLARSLREGYSVIFLCSAETVHTVPALSQSGFEIRHGDSVEQADWLIVDHYGLDEAYERSSRAWAEQIMVIDDLANRQHDCDILLDQTYDRNPADYKNLVPSFCKILTGAAYAILSPAFAAWRQTARRDFERPERILVSFGGVNPKGSTEFALRALSHFRDWRLLIDVTTGAHANDLKKVQSVVNRINGKKFHQIRLHIDTLEMARLMADADLCIGAGGTTSWERCCLKLPAITLELADNQRFVLQQLDGAGAICNLGPIESVSGQTLIANVTRLLGDPEKLQKMGQMAGALCDGRGTERIAPYLLKPLETRDGRRVMLRSMGMEDCKQLYEWQITPAVRQYARNPQPPSWDGHQRWFAESLGSLQRHLFMVECDGQPAGMVRLDSIEDDMAFEVSVLVDPQYRGCGVGAAALSLLRALVPSVKLKAEVLEGNTASKKLFEKADYIPVSDTWYESCPEQKGE